MAKCKHLTIFEGPDGSGKTTAALAYAVQTNAKYIHFDACLGVTKSLGRRYVEAMLPAILGYQNVVFDRCWLSEFPYKSAFHGGPLRVDHFQIRMLERLAMKCGAVVVQCRPPWDIVAKCFNGRTEDEMMDNVDQLKQVYKLYGSQEQGLPELHYDYTQDLIGPEDIEKLRMPLHEVDAGTAGNLDGSVFIRSRNNTERLGDFDPFYQWPEGLLHDETCYYITQQLHQLEIEEKDIMWGGPSSQNPRPETMKEIFIADIIGRGEWTTDQA